MRERGGGLRSRASERRRAAARADAEHQAPPAADVWTPERLAEATVPEVAAAIDAGALTVVVAVEWERHGRARKGILALDPDHTDDGPGDDPGVED